eukprot:SAG11_NODE_6383_length_1324_cov_1.751020_1_plen_74_part_10
MVTSRQCSFVSLCSAFALHSVQCTAERFAAVVARVCAAGALLGPLIVAANLHFNSCYPSCRTLVPPSPPLPPPP